MVCFVNICRGLVDMEHVRLGLPAVPCGVMDVLGLEGVTHVVGVHVEGTGVCCTGVVHAQL